MLTVLLLVMNMLRVFYWIHLPNAREEKHSNTKGGPVLALAIHALAFVGVVVPGLWAVAVAVRFVIAVGLKGVRIRST